MASRTFAASGRSDDPQVSHPHEAAADGNEAVSLYATIKRVRYPPYLALSALPVTIPLCHSAVDGICERGQGISDARLAYPHGSRFWRGCPRSGSTRFVQKYRGQFFSSVPLVLGGPEQRTIDYSALTSNDAPVAVTLDFKKWIENILQVLPATTHIAWVIGASPLEPSAPT
jgi:hypothetical protein